MFFYPRGYVQVPSGICLTTLGKVQLPLGICLTTLGGLLNYPRGFHKMRRALFLLAAVNPENWLQDKVLDNTFNVLNFLFMNLG